MPHATEAVKTVHILPALIATEIKGFDAEKTTAEMTSRIRTGEFPVKECP
jgi:hypothetical protein